VGSEGLTSEENRSSAPIPEQSLSQQMELFLTRMLALQQPQRASSVSIQLVEFNPDDEEADIEGWCNVTDIIIKDRNLEGADLLVLLTRALKGRATTCLTRLQASQLTWPQIKELLLAKFAKPMMPQDYFDQILRFQVGPKETATEAAIRLWNIIGRIPRMEMPEDIITGFVTSVLCQKDALIRRELQSYSPTTRSQLLRILNGISLKRKHEGNDIDPDAKKNRFNDVRFTGTCHRCGTSGHKAVDCRRRKEEPTPSDKTRNTVSRGADKPITCFVCGRPGHIASACPDRAGRNGAAAVKEVHVCERKASRSTLTTSSGELVSFLFDSGSACSLVSKSYADKFPGTAQRELVYLTGIGNGEVECVSQVVSSVNVQGLLLSVLFHIVPDGTIIEPVIIGRDILEDNVHVQIGNEQITFSRYKNVSLAESSGFNFTNIDTDLQGDDKLALVRILEKYSEFFIDNIPTRRVTTGVLRIVPIDPDKTRCINTALGPLKDKVALAYMDDVMCYSNDVTTGLERLDRTLKALSDAGFSLNIKKCKFMKNKIDYLGYVIKAGEVTPNPKKIQALIDAPTPKTATQVRQFLGLASYFRRFIPNFTRLVGPLYPLTKLKGPIKWTESHNDIHKKIVDILTSEPVLTIFDPDSPIELHTDASSGGYGAILIQRKNNAPHVVSYFSRRTSDTESRYHSYELETLAVVRAVENFRHYLYGQRFTVFTDCNSLKSSKTKTDLTPRVHRWWAFLQAYDFDIVHKQGISMGHADYLSRNPISEPISSVQELDDLNESKKRNKEVHFVELHQGWLAVEQKRDSEICDLISKCENNELPEAIAHTYDVRKGVLYRKIERNRTSLWLPIVPRSLTWTLINHVHSEIMHLGADKTLNKIYEQYWFPQMAKQVRKFVDSCIVCKASKGCSGAQQIRLHPIPKVSTPWHTVHIDITGKLSGKSDKKEYVSVIIDAFTKYVLLEYTPSLDAASAIQCLKKAVCLFGSPKRIIADQGRCYISADFKRFCGEHGIDLHLISTGASRANGQVERIMRTLKCLLTIVENDPNKTWRDELPGVQLALNSTRSRVTGYSPTELMFGIQAQSLGISTLSTHAEPEPRLDLDIIRHKASENIKKAASSEEKRFNQGRAKVKPFNAGDFVFIKGSERNQTKLQRKFKGPFIIVRVLDHDRYELRDIDGSKRTYKYAHEKLRAVPGGYGGLVEVATFLIHNEEEAETAAVHCHENGMATTDDDSDTVSVSSLHTLTASSDTLSASEHEE
ncbi:unnamed protein product, partial [Leptosia nina]